MEEMGKQMIKHCGGLPLAVKVLGGLLAQQYTLREWKRVYEDIRSQIIGRTSFNDRNNSSVYHILSLSFEELPICLKYCFMYLALFPEDYLIDVEKLSSGYWAAEGIPKPEYYERASIREVADGYIEELVKRNMVISERDVGTSRFVTCHLHDMMREVCLLKAGEENFLQIIHSTSTANSTSLCKSRRLAVHWHDKAYHRVWEMKNPKLRSLLFMEQLNWMELRSSVCFTSLQLMRVLDLSRVQFKGGKLPSSIGKLIHLKYLSLYMAHVTHLPSSMRNMKLLLYLNLCVRESCSVYMPDFLKEMRKLRYLSFPLTIYYKVKMELGNLVNLETLENFSTEHGRVTDLQGMTRLETLSILFNGKGCTLETLSSSLSELRQLENLTINDTTLKAREFVLDCINLKQLKLSTYCWNHFFINVSGINKLWSVKRNGLVWSMRNDKLINLTVSLRDENYFIEYKINTNTYSSFNN